MNADTTNMTLPERIKHIRTSSKNKTRPAFATSLGIATNYVYLIETGKENPSKRLLQDICRVYGVSYEWLNTGNGDIYEDQIVVRSIVGSIVGDNEFAVNLISSMASMPLDWWKDLEKLVTDLKDRVDEKKQK